MRIFNRQKQMELMQASIRSEEDVRTRIATELHDDVGATLSSVRLFLHHALRNPHDTDLSAQTKELLDEGIRKIRDLSHQLQPSTLQYLGLVKALESFAEMIIRTANISMETALNPDSWIEPEPQTALAIYRIVQELVSNSIKHARASVIHLATHYSEGRQCICLSHNGIGITETDYQNLLCKKDSFGLKNIEHRVQSAGLSMAFPDPEAGVYRIILRLPRLSDNS